VKKEEDSSLIILLSLTSSFFDLNESYNFPTSLKLDKNKSGKKKIFSAPCSEFGGG